jgi:hypothetical protein
MRLKELVDQQGLDHRRIVTDLVIAARQRPAQLKPVQRRLARHGSAILSPGFELAGEDRHHRVMAELIVVVEVLVAERQSEHPLADQRLDLVLDQLRAAKVMETGGEAIDEADRPAGRAKQQRAGVRSDAPAIESRHHRTTIDRYKSKQIRDTVCLHRGAHNRQWAIPPEANGGFVAAMEDVLEAPGL